MRQKAAALPSLKVSSKRRAEWCHYLMFSKYLKLISDLKKICFYWFNLNCQKSEEQTAAAGKTINQQRELLNLIRAFERMMPKMTESFQTLSETWSFRSYHVYCFRSAADSANSSQSETPSKTKSRSKDVIEGQLWKYLWYGTRFLYSARLFFLLDGGKMEEEEEEEGEVMREKDYWKGRTQR